MQMGDCICDSCFSFGLPVHFKTGTLYRMCSLKKGRWNSCLLKQWLSGCFPVAKPELVNTSVTLSLFFHARFPSSYLGMASVKQPLLMLVLSERLLEQALPSLFCWKLTQLLVSVVFLSFHLPFFSRWLGITCTSPDCKTRRAGWLLLAPLTVTHHRSPA